jgi:hypothetical protein
VGVEVSCSDGVELLLAVVEMLMLRLGLWVSVPLTEALSLGVRVPELDSVTLGEGEALGLGEGHLPSTRLHVTALKFKDIAVHSIVWLSMITSAKFGV